MTDQTFQLTEGVTLTVVDANCVGNNLAAPGEGAVHDGTSVPQEARDDYLWCQSDARIRIDGLPAGAYSITVFEGRATDDSQHGKIWSGANNMEWRSGNFAGGSTTVDVVVATGSSLYYEHLEDNTGGTSGMMIKQVGERNQSKGFTLCLSSVLLLTSYGTLPYATLFLFSLLVCAHVHTYAN